MRILIVEDELRLSDSIKKGLTEAGFAVDQAFDGEEGLFMATSETYDCLLLDIMLPKINGLEVCRKLRSSNNHIPIIMLTAKNTTEDIAAGLDSGADDYLAKPFSFVELLSRLRALIRRSQKIFETTLKIADLVLDPVKHTVLRNNRPISLTPKEFSILEFLLYHQGEAVTRTMITEHVWDYNFDSMSNLVDVFITTLRKKIDYKSKVKLIHTIRGIGFSLSESKNK